MTFLNESVFTQTDKQRVDAVLYQAMFDEVIRLRKCSNPRERKSIREFLTVAYQLLAERIPENASQDTFQGSNSQ